MFQDYFQLCLELGIEVEILQVKVVVMIILGTLLIEARGVDDGTPLTYRLKSTRNAVMLMCVVVSVRRFTAVVIGTACHV